MLSTSTIFLIPFIIAFIGFLIKFYFHERAGSKRSPTFLLAIATAVLPLTFLALKIFGVVIPYYALGMGIVGCALVVASIVRFFQV
ncbi:MAG: hypothetical protein AB7O80_22155 [Acetobacteraceae bacterium]